MEICKYDKNCPNLEVCYSDVVWLKEISFPHGNNEMKNCYCSSYFGVQRNPVTGICDEFTSITYTFFLIISFYIGISFIGFILSLFVITKSKIMSSCSFNTSATTLMLICVSFFIISIKFSIDIKIINTQSFKPSVYCNILDDKSEKCGYYKLITGILNIIMISCTIFACLNICLAWIEISLLVNISINTNTTKFRKPIIIIIFSIVFFITILILGPITDSWEYTVFVTAPFFTWIIICYSYGFYLMKHILNSQSLFNVTLSDRVKTRNKLILDEIRKISFIIIITIGFLIIDEFAISYIAYTGWKNYTPIGKFPLTTIVDYSETFFVLILNFSVLRYLYFIIYSPNKKPNDGARIESTKNAASKLSSRSWKSFKVDSILPNNGINSQENQNSHYYDCYHYHHHNSNNNNINNNNNNHHEDSIGAIFDETSNSLIVDQ